MDFIIKSIEVAIGLGLGLGVFIAIICGIDKILSIGHKK